MSTFTGRRYLLVLMSFVQVRANSQGHTRMSYLVSTSSGYKNEDIGKKQYIYNYIFVCIYIRVCELFSQSPKC